MNNYWIETHSGIQFNLIEPSTDMVKIFDIAHHLAHINRFTGALKSFYSVAEHSYLASMQKQDSIDKELALYLLIHDAHEAYVGDISSPLKAALKNHNGNDAFETIEHGIQDAICNKLKLTYPYPSWIQKEVKRIDARMLATEKRDLLESKLEWANEAMPYDFKLHFPADPQKAKAQFLRRFNELF